MAIKIIGVIPKNPYLKIHYGSVARLKSEAFVEGQQSVLSLAKEVDLNKHPVWLKNCMTNRKRKCQCCGDCPFESFIKEQMEGK